MPEPTFDEDKEVENVKKFLLTEMRGNKPPSDVATLANAYYSIISAESVRQKDKKSEIVT